jgi:hypothetical protein
MVQAIEIKFLTVHLHRERCLVLFIKDCGVALCLGVECAQQEAEKYDYGFCHCKSGYFYHLEAAMQRYAFSSKKQFPREEKLFPSGGRKKNGGMQGLLFHRFLCVAFLSLKVRLPESDTRQSARR